MFDVGQFYSVKMWEDSSDDGIITEHGARKVVEFKCPLVTFEDFDGGEITINAASLAFVSATKKAGGKAGAADSDEPGSIEPDYT
jgi:hypothetical protein